MVFLCVMIEVLDCGSADVFVQQLVDRNLWILLFAQNILRTPEPQGFFFFCLGNAVA